MKKKKKFESRGGMVFSSRCRCGVAELKVCESCGGDFYSTEDFVCCPDCEDDWVNR